MDTTRLRLVNDATLPSDQQILIYGVVQDQTMTVIAWMLVSGLGTSDTHAFELPLASEVGVRYGEDNLTPRLSAPPIQGDLGTRFAMVQTPTGDELQLVGPTSGDNNLQVEVANQLAKDAIWAQLFKQGLLFAEVGPISPSSGTGFIEATVLQFAIVQGMRQGESFTPDPSVATELDLSGVERADIVLTGGDGQPFAFALENVVKAQ